MFLCIIFNHETIPFILQEATDAECLRAIEKAKEDFVFDRQSAIVREDHIFLHAWSKNTNLTKNPKKRLYCYNDKVILQTDTKCKDEIESTRELLAYEHGINVDRICVIEI
jgi:hypothetical protein